MSKGPPEDFFREIGFDNHLWSDGASCERIFFIGPTSMSDPRGERRQSASPAAIAEFISYWANQIQVAAEYLENDSNPNTHEWR